MTKSKLSKALMVSNGKVTQMIESLLVEGLVMRKVHVADRRFATVRLTRKGTNVFRDVASANKRWVEQMLTGMSDSEVDGLNDLLATLRRSVELQSPSAFSNF